MCSTVRMDTGLACGRTRHVFMWDRIRAYRLHKPTLTEYGGRFIGKIDDVRLYDRDLNGNEVSRLYLTEKTVSLPLAQDFDSSPDAQQWFLQKTFADSSVAVTNGVANILNRGKIITSTGATQAPLTLEASFRFSGSQNDVFRIVWGSTGDDSNIQNGALEFLNGIRLDQSSHLWGFHRFGENKSFGKYLL